MSPYPSILAVATSAWDLKMRRAAVLTALVLCALRAADAAPVEDEVMLFTLA